MSDEQPRPRYGEYAPGYTPGQEPPAGRPEDAAAPPPPPPVPQYAPWGTSPGEYRAPVKTRNRADLVVTVILLVLGLVGTLAACIYAAIFANPELLNEGLRMQGRGDFNGQVGQAPLILVVSHVVLYLLAVGLSILSLVKKRITFWIPLLAGVVAGVIFWVTVGTVFASDPSLIQQFSR